MKRLTCLALSVDIDRFTDRKIDREYLPMFGEHASSAADVRRLCALERAKGHDVFPPHDGNTKPDGMCAGHEIPETEAEWSSIATQDGHRFVQLLEEDMLPEDLVVGIKVAATLAQPSPARALMKLLSHARAEVVIAAVESAEAHPTWAMHACLVHASVHGPSSEAKRRADEAAARMYRRLAP